MTFSSLITGTVPHHGKYTSRYGTTISRVILHHWAGTAGGDARLTNPNEAASVNYIVYSDGHAVGQVPEEYRAWTSGSWEADAPSITIEIQNSTGAPEWKISDAAFKKVVEIIIDVAKRHNFGKLTRKNVRGHREFYATACPGPYVWSHMDEIVKQANAGTGSKPPTPPKPNNNTSIDKRTLEDLVNATIRGEFGDGAERVRKLGKRYTEVQREVNRRLNGDKNLPKPPKPQSVNLERLADAVIRGDYGNGEDRKKNLGSNYDAVMKIVNARLLGTPNPKPKPVDYEALADAVIRGDYGNGEDRKKKLGNLYGPVMKIVNRRLLG